jgi:hypothetical protein
MDQAFYCDWKVQDGTNQIVFDVWLRAAAIEPPVTTTKQQKIGNEKKRSEGEKCEEMRSLREARDVKHWEPVMMQHASIS